MTLAIDLLATIALQLTAGHRDAMPLLQLPHAAAHHLIRGSLAA